MGNMLKELIDEYIKDKSTIITAKANGGTTSLCLFIANTLLNDNNVILYFNPQDNIEKTFVYKFYPRVYSDVIFSACSVTELLYFLQYLNFKVDYLILDPGDCLMYNSKLLPMLKSTIKGNIICTSQIRTDLSQGGRVYSTIEKKYMPTKLFDSSLWIRSVTEPSSMFIKKYIDVFNTVRSGNNFIARYIANFTKEGNIVA